MASNQSDDNYYAGMESVWADSYPSADSLEAVEEFYRESAYEGGFAPYLEQLLSAPQLKLSRGRVLDFGCDTGVMLNYFKVRDLELYGVDINSSALRRGRELFPDFNLLRIFGLEIPFIDKYFDLIYTGAVLKHIRYEDRARLYAEFGRTSDFLIVCEKNSEKEWVEEKWGFTFYHSNFREELRNYFDEIKLLEIGEEILGLYKVRD